jgi:DNA-directed RNA polymerase specialized sigma subunit
LTIELWRKHQVDGDTDALHELCTLWMPRVTQLAFSYKHRMRDAIAEEVDDLISIGSLTLLKVCAGHRFTPGADDGFCRYLSRAIIKGFKVARRDSLWGGCVLAPVARARATFRRQFAWDHGRAPTKDEVTAHLATIITNPNIQVGERRAQHNFSDLQNPTDEARVVDAIDNRPDPGDSSFDGESMRLALKLFKGEDRTMFKLVMEGTSQGEIGKRFKLGEGALRRRINGLLWRARCNSELAASLGVKAEPCEIRSPANALASVRKLPPAPLAKTA